MLCSRYFRSKECGNADVLYNDIAGEIPRDFLGYEQKKDDENYVECTIMTIVRLDTLLVTVLSSVLEIEVQGGHR